MQAHGPESNHTDRSFVPQEIAASQSVAKRWYAPAVNRLIKRNEDPGGQRKEESYLNTKLYLLSAYYYCKEVMA